MRTWDETQSILLRIVEKYEQYNYINKFDKIEMHNQIREKILIKPKDEFESIEDYQKRLDAIRANKRNLLSSIRKEQLETLNQLASDINRQIDSTALFSQTIRITSNNKELEFSLGAYNVEKKSFPIFITPHLPLVEEKLLLGSINIQNTDSARSLKQSYDNHTLSLTTLCNLFHEPSDSISLLFRTVDLEEGN
jgi:hypothetical protein